MNNDKKHTDGNWSKSSTVAGSISGENGTLVCSMWQLQGSEERKANESLICAAPELLDAVEDALVLLEYFFTEGISVTWASDVEKKLKSARDKALRNH